MLPDIGASELMVIALVALVFVGPKDLPVMLKKLGQFTSKMRRMAADFRTSFDDMARQSELEDLRREVEQMRASATQAVSDPIGIDSTLRETIDEMDTAMSHDDSYDYQPAVPAVEELGPVEPVPEPKPPRKRAAARKPAAAKDETVEVAAASDAPAKPRRRAASPAGEAPAKPRRRAATKAAS